MSIMVPLEHILKVLGDERRFEIISLLLKYDMCVSALSQRLGISSAAISQHLQILRKSGLVKGEKRGYWTHYIVQREVLKEAAELLMRMSQQMPDSETECTPQNCECGSCSS